MKKSIFSFFCLILLTGCIGAGPIQTETIVKKSNGFPDAICPEFGKPGNVEICSTEEVGKFDRDKIIKFWGNPKKIYQENGNEYLAYNSNLAWRGLVLIIIVVPIPLVAPVGYNEIIFELRNEKINRVFEEYGKSNIAACGLFPDTGFSCRSGY